MISKKEVLYIQSIFLVIGSALVINGLLKLSWPHAIPWGSGGLRLILFLVIAFAFVSFLMRRFRWTPFQAAVLGTVLIATASGALWPLLVTLWFALASVMLGRSVLYKMRVKVDDFAVYFIVGAGIYGTVIGLLAHFPVNYPALYAIALAAPFAVHREKLLQYLGQLQHFVAKSAQPEKQDAIRLEIVIAILALVYIVIAHMPELGYDALAMHLFIPGHLAERHKWSFDATTYVWAVMPALGDWIFSIVYMLGGETATRLTNVGFIFVMAWFTQCLVLWAGGTTRNARWATLIFLSSPLTFTEGSSLFIESIWASFLVGGTIALLDACFSDKGGRNHLSLTGLLLGLALAAKAVTFTFLPALLPILLWRYKAWLKSATLSTMLQGATLFFIIGCVPYVTAWWLTGNPIFPFFNKIFQSPLWPSINFDSSAVFGRGITWDVLYRITFQSEKYLEARNGAAGFQWLLLFLPASITLLWLGHRRGIALLLVGGLSVVFTFQSVSYLRYVFPTWAILAAAIGVGMNRESRASIKKIWECAAIGAISLNIAFLNAGANYSDFAINSTFSQSDRENYLSERLPLRSAVNLVNALNTGNGPVAVFAHPLMAGLRSNALYPNWYDHTFQASINAAKSEQDIANVLMNRGSDFIIFDSSWREIGGQMDLVEAATVPIAEFGNVTVRKVKADYQFATELLVNPNFADAKGWTLLGQAKLDGDESTVTVNVDSPAVQAVQIAGGHRYLNTVVARCVNEAGQGRIQVNWSDNNGKFISPEIRTFDCTTNWKKHDMKVVAPKNATSATVYASGHSQIPIEFKEVSFRQ